MSSSLDPYKALCSVGPDLGPNCPQNSSAEDTADKAFALVLLSSQQEQGLEIKE